MSREEVIAQIERAFGDNVYPGDGYLPGSVEGCEPFEEVGPFQGKVDWREIAPDFLDSHGGALSFFTEAGFRFYLPAFLIADLRGELQYADPLFHLTHGFFDFSVNIEKQGRTLVIRSGKSKLINPRRYGAIASFDHARYRLSVFTREEAAAIVAYLQFKRAEEEQQLQNSDIDAALELFWLERAQSAPTDAELRRQLAEEEEYYRSICAEKSAD